MGEMTHIDLFSGIGGFAMAARWAGFKTVAFVEIEPYAQALIKQNFGAVADDNKQRCFHGEPKEFPNYRYEQTFSESESGNQSSALYRDIRTFDGTRYRGATLLTGGFPCQPFSQAGKRRGKEDDRYLWPEMLRVIHDARPAWVLGENVAGIVTMELDRVLSDLEGKGYAVQALIVPACAVDAKHRRDRVWIVANSNEGRLQQRLPERQSLSGGMEAEIERASEDMADASRIQQGRQEQRTIGERAGECGKSFSHADSESPRWFAEPRQKYCEWLPEPNVGGSSNGLPHWLDRHHGKGMSHEKNIRSIETLRSLWNHNVSQALWQAARGLDRVQQAEVLFSFVREYSKGSDEARLLVAGKKASNDFLLSLRRTAATPSPSRRSKQSKQQSGEHSNALQVVSQLPSFDGETAWPSYGWEDGLPRVATGVADRVSRLKGLGNAIVPQVAFEILKGIAEIEK